MGTLLNWLRGKWHSFRIWFAGQLVEHLEPRRVFWALLLGVTIGTSPFWGLHLVACVFLARVLRLNKALMVLGSGVANPITGPALLALSAAVGSFFRSGHFGIPDLDFSGDYRPLLDQGGWLVFDLIAGSLVVGPAIGAVVGAFGVLWVRRFPPPPVPEA